MSRREQKFRGLRVSVPRASGDEPKNVALVAGVLVCSPRERG